MAVFHDANSTANRRTNHASIDALPAHSLRTNPTHSVVLMDSVQLWTGRAACSLQAALRMSNESFAAHLGIAARTVAMWHQKPDRVPQPEIQQALDTALARADEGSRSRFANSQPKCDATTPTGQPDDGDSLTPGADLTSGSTPAIIDAESESRAGAYGLVASRSKCDGTARRFRCRRDHPLVPDARGPKSAGRGRPAAHDPVQAVQAGEGHADPAGRQRAATRRPPARHPAGAARRAPRPLRDATRYPRTSASGQVQAGTARSTGARSADSSTRTARCWATSRPSCTPCISAYPARRSSPQPTGCRTARSTSPTSH